MLGIIGPNGAGKSTLFKLMTGLLKPQSGGIRLKDKALGEWPRREIARQVAVVPQGEEGSFPFTVEELVLMGRSPHLRGMLALESEEDRQIAAEALETVGLSEFASHPVESLSGGERQLALVARAIAQQTPAMLLDEPTASLDLAHQQQIMRVIARLNRERGLTVVVVAHDLNLTARYCNRLAVLHEGRIAAEGAPAEVLNEELLRRVYGADIWMATAPDGAAVVGVSR